MKAIFQQIGKAPSKFKAQRGMEHIG